ncbi:MAG TPA: acetyl-CoA carboxylase carboxyl transferase subunit alpha, partial [Pirellulales bacterium]
MASATQRLAFERPILELEAKIVKLETADGSDYARLEEIRQQKRELAELKRHVYSSLTPWETVQVARHP